MTQCKMYIIAGNNNEQMIKEMLADDNFTGVYLGMMGTAMQFEIKKVGVDPTAGEKTAIESAARDLGIRLKWI